MSSTNATETLATNTTLVSDTGSRNNDYTGRGTGGRGCGHGYGDGRGGGG